MIIGLMARRAPPPTKPKGRTRRLPFSQNQSIHVFFDNASTYNRFKAVMIDDENVIAGSSNRTDSALNRNQGTNFPIKSKSLAQQILADLKTVPHDAPLPKDDDAAVQVPTEFLLNEDHRGDMSRGDERALDISLYLFRKPSRFPRPGPFTLRNRMTSHQKGNTIYKKESIEFICRKHPTSATIPN